MPILRRNEEYYNDIVSGWNEKLTLSTKQLSGLMPFVELYTLYDVGENNETRDVRTNEPIITHILRTKKLEEIIEVEINARDNKEDLVLETVNNVPSYIQYNSRLYKYLSLQIGRLESQTASSDTLGGVGINSLRVNRGTRQSFTSIYDMDLTIMSPKLIKTNVELSALYALNQKFLIIYGWSNLGDKKPPFPTQELGSQFKSLKLNLSQANSKGSWSFAVISLQKFNFSMETTGQLRAKLTFLNANATRLSYDRTKDISTKVVRALQTPYVTIENPETATVGPDGRAFADSDPVSVNTQNRNQITNIIRQSSLSQVELWNEPQFEYIPNVYIAKTDPAFFKINNVVNRLVSQLDADIQTKELGLTPITNQTGQILTQTNRENQFKIRDYVLRNATFNNLEHDENTRKIYKLSYFISPSPEERVEINVREYVIDYLSFRFFPLLARWRDSFYNQVTNRNLIKVFNKQEEKIAFEEGVDIVYENFDTSYAPSFVRLSDVRAAITKSNFDNRVLYGTDLIRKLRDSSLSNFTLINRKYAGELSLPSSTVITVDHTFKSVQHQNSAQLTQDEYIEQVGGSLDTLQPYFYGASWRRGVPQETDSSTTPDEYVVSLYDTVRDRAQSTSIERGYIYSAHVNFYKIIVEIKDENGDLIEGIRGGTIKMWQVKQVVREVNINSSNAEFYLGRGLNRAERRIIDRGQSVTKKITERSLELVAQAPVEQGAAIFNPKEQEDTKYTEEHNANNPVDPRDEKNPPAGASLDIVRSSTVRQANDDNPLPSQRVTQHKTAAAIINYKRPQNSAKLTKDTIYIYFTYESNTFPNKKLPLPSGYNFEEEGEIIQRKFISNTISNGDVRFDTGDQIIINDKTIEVLRNYATENNITTTVEEPEDVANDESRIVEKEVPAVEVLGAVDSEWIPINLKQLHDGRNTISETREEQDSQG